MADFYANEFVGGPDGTQNPPKKLDGRLVGAKKRRTRAQKPTAQAFAAGDRLYIGKIPQGASVRGFTGITNTSFGTTTVSIGTTANPTKYVNTKTLTASDTPTALGPNAATFFQPPLTADEDIWVTFGTATLNAGSIAGFDLEYTIST
ncbi:hypothetical protein [Sphingomonas jatrophae]|uniref:Uncharacterized protein n=1 Tax=Sphingomonas jatrophae TaxID=1166337 RepID=A0A1I6K5M6_9SPHN|nr:hypothetical protein [Sphingomonas jatrophae]SFR86487.1 hypothetical protein SAMN05192580_1350 [Sphingomonas jatrophae]